MTSSPYRCPMPECRKGDLVRDQASYRCGSGHVFPIRAGTNIPVFLTAPPPACEYSAVDAAEIHDNALRWLFATFRADEATFRRRLVSRLQLTPGQKVLITGAGAGNDLPFVAEALDGEGEIFAQDIAAQMLVAGQQRYAQQLSGSKLRIEFSVSDAMNLPFADQYFDAAYHFGGINLFPDIAKGLSEMARVVRDGGRIVVGDEGVAPWLAGTELHDMLVKNNPLYACKVPLSAIPTTARSVKLSWELSNCFYVVEYCVGHSPLSIDIDVQHVGKRGGTIRSRYFGQLEGVSPELRDRIYAMADDLGMSRVEYLERVLRQGLEDNVGDQKA